MSDQPVQILDVSCGPDGSAYIVLTDDLLAHLGVDEGDTLKWLDNGDGTFTLKKAAAKPQTSLAAASRHTATQNPLEP